MRLLVPLTICLALLPLAASAQSAQELRAQIDALLEQVAELQAQLAALEQEAVPADFRFERRLEPGMAGEDVRYLQIVLNRSPDTRLALSGPGSPGEETAYFGALSADAVSRFQETYAHEVLSPWGLSQGTGIVGITTRAKLNELVSGESIAASRVSVSSLRARQADTLLVTVQGEPGEEMTGEFAGTDIPFFEAGERRIGIVPVDVKAPPGPYPLTLQSSNGGSLVRVVVVEKRDFPVTVLATTPELEERGYTPEQIKKNAAEQDNVLLYEVIQKFSPEVRFSQPFVHPLDEIINVGAYGNIRRSGTVELQHLGVDLDAELGTPVYAANSGVVRFRKETINYGKTAVIDHGLGIYSLYLHLDEFLVQDGQEVERGDVIARVGNTGYSLDPHLHFSIRANGASVDPLKFIEAIAF